MKPTASAIAPSLSDDQAVALAAVAQPEEAEGRWEVHPFGRVTGSQSGLGDSVCNKSWAEGAEVYQGILGVAAGVEGLSHYRSKGGQHRITGPVGQAAVGCWLCILSGESWPMGTGQLERITGWIKVEKRIVYGYRGSEYFFMRIEIFPSLIPKEPFFILYAFY